MALSSELGINHSELGQPQGRLSQGEVSSSEITPLFNPNVRVQLKKFGTEDDVINRLYDARGNFIYTTPDDLDFESMSFAAISHELQERTRPVYDAVDNRLREDKPENGYNKHNLDNHIVHVATMADDIVRMGRHGDRIRRLTLEAAMGHDLGNINDRREHAADSTILYPYVVPSLARNEEEMRIVLGSIRLHDERVITREMSGLKTAEQRQFRVLEMDEEVGEGASVVLAALVLADKADIDRGRINEAAINREAVARDEHVWVNLCAKNEGFTYDRASKSLVLRIAFDPRLEGEELEHLKPISRKRSHHDGFRIDYPQDVQKRYKAGVPVFYQWATSLKKIYADRIGLMAEMTPIVLDANNFRLELVDRLAVADRASEGAPNVRIDAEVISQTFEPQYIDSLLETNATKFLPDGKADRHRTTTTNDIFVA